jgi:hypothetical protein
MSADTRPRQPGGIDTDHHDVGVGVAKRWSRHVMRPRSRSSTTADLQNIEPPEDAWPGRSPAMSRTTATRTVDARWPLLGRLLLETPPGHAYPRIVLPSRRLAIGSSDRRERGN